MKKVRLLIIMTMLFSNAFAQLPFEKTYGSMDDDMGFSVAVCPDGTFLVCGYTTEFWYGYQDMYILKLDQDGDTLWTKTIGQLDEYEWAYSITPTYDLGFVVAGFTTNNDSQTPCLIKFDQEGNQEWIKEYSTYVPDGVATSVIQTEDSGFALCGNSVYTDEDLWGSKAFVIRTLQDGEVDWFKNYGWVGVHYVSQLLENENGGFSVCGQYDTLGEYAASWLFYTWDEGSLVYNYISGGIENTESAWDVKMTSDNGYILCGTKFNGFILMDGDIQVIKTNKYLVEEWSRTYSSEEDDRASSIDITEDGGYIICGSTDGYGAGYDDVWLIRTDENGDTLWTKTYGGYYGDRGHSVKTTPDGGFIICGMTGSMGNGMSDVYIIKTNHLGTLVWSNEYPSEHKVVKVFPNPGSGIFHLQSSKEIIEVQIVDMHGNTIHRFKPSNSKNKELSVDLQNQAAGIYFFHLFFDNKVYVQKVIKH